MLAVGHDEVFAAAIAGVALVTVSVIQNARGFRRGHAERRELRDATSTLAHDAANGVGAAAREEMRSAVRDIVEELAKLNVKLDAVLETMDEHGNGHLENGGEHG